MSYGDFVRQLPSGPAALPGELTIWHRLRIDLPLLLLLMILSTVGLVVLYSASDGNMRTVARQSQYLVVAYLAMFFVAQFNIDRLKRLALLAYLCGVMLLILVAVMGTGAKGAQRWLDLGGFRFQPSEIMKLVVPMVLAWYLAVHPLPPRFQQIVISLGLIGVPTLLIASQPDLGTSILIAASGLFVLFLAGISWRFIFSCVLLLVASAWPLWQFVLHDYQKTRVLTLLNPESDKLGAGWNIIQSKTAIGSGGWDGKGYLQGTQSHLDFLPESHTDFIIAVLAEEFGLIGVMGLMLLYLLIIFRGIWIASQAKHCFGRLLAGSIVLTFFVYVGVNVGMVSGLLPVVGVPLPLVSQGGTSLVTLLAGFGILMGLSVEKRLVHQ